MECRRTGCNDGVGGGGDGGGGGGVSCVHAVAGGRAGARAQTVERGC